MIERNPNRSIRCSVSACTYHKGENCTLDEIKVGTCSPAVTDCASTECASFRLEGSGRSGVSRR